MNTDSNIKEVPVVGMEEFKKDLKDSRLITFDGVLKFKSINRAIKRGHASMYGEVYPKRPFNNRKNTPGRKLNALKQSIYNELKYGRKV